MRTTYIFAIASTLTTLALGPGCTLEEGGLDASDLDDASSEEGAETLDDGAETEEDYEFRTYEGVIIANPWYGTNIRAGTTVGKTHEFSPTCAYSNNAPDVSYTWTAPTTASFTFTTRGSSYDTVLHIRPFSNSAQTLGCNDDIDGTLQSSVSLNLTQGTTVIIVVDGYSNKSGSFKLNISKGAQCPGGCNNPPTQCHQDSGPCLIDPVGGSASCYYPAKWTGSDCDDGNWCSTGSHCVNFSCVPDSFRSCNTPPSTCYEGWGMCDWGSESCVYTPKAAGTACSDGLACTSGDACNGAGACVPTSNQCGPIEPINPCSGYGPNLEDCNGQCCAVGTNCQLCVALE